MNQKKPQVRRSKRATVKRIAKTYRLRRDVLAILNKIAKIRRVSRTAALETIVLETLGGPKGSTA